MTLMMPSSSMSWSVQPWATCKAMPPLSFFLNTIFGGFLLSRIPKPSSSYSIFLFCIRGFITSSTMRMRLQLMATLMTCFPRPLPSLAPSMIPGRSSIWSLAPLYRTMPGMQVRVVNSYEATSLSWPVILLSSVDLPTDGKPTKPIRASPVLDTSKPAFAGPPPLPFVPSVTICARSLASLAFSRPRCPFVALFFCVLAISASISAIFTRGLLIFADGWRASARVA
mmetsp:Transcript_69137/g.124645  ORF Transcript_69137/g.124645 Transcript_69137/m.124645 type:complete len:226 (+) Transcript_69137:696-1373(+)